jgi:hypothetical protein
MTKQELYAMELHEKKNIRSGGTVTEWVLRVVGGWIYYHQNLVPQCITSNILVETATFVPEQESQIISVNEPDLNILRLHDILDMEINNWLSENYDEKHRLNSLRHHLGVDEPYLCENYKRKQDYLKYLKDK